MGLGGEGILRTFGYEKEAYSLINRALDLGVTYFESARAYSGSESYYGSALQDRRKDIFLTSKSHARDKEGALAHLRETLNNMKTDYLDLWQIHDVRTIEDVQAIFGPDGALEAFIEAKKKGMTRFIGITGHHDPSITRQCIEKFDFDTVLVPVNPAEPTYKSFVDEILPLANGKQMGLIGMKVYFRGLAGRIPKFTSFEPLFRFALSQTIHTAVIGCDDLNQVDENVGFARNFQSLPEAEMLGLKELISPYARKLMYYKP